IWEYATKHLGYSNGAASRRIDSMRLLREIPELKEDILSGAQSITSLTQAHQFFSVEEKHRDASFSSDQKREVLNQMRGLSTRDCEKALLKMSSAPVELTHPQKERPLNDEYTELRVALPKRVLTKLKRVQAIRSHADPTFDYVILLEYMADDVLRRLDPIEKE